MGFLSKKKKAVNISISILCIADLIAAYIINKLSQTPFHLWSKKNIILLAILIFLVIILIVCNIIKNNQEPGIKPKKLQKAFQQSGGYELVASELKNCIQDGNMKKLKHLKKMVNIIEK